MNDVSLYLNGLIIIGGAIIAFLAFVDQIAKKFPFFGLIQTLTFKFTVLIIGTVGIAVGTILKDKENNDNVNTERAYYIKEISKKDSSFKKERHIADSVHQAKLQMIVDSSYAKSIKASNEALAKYNLVLIDSLKTVAINKSSLAELSIAPKSPGDSPILVRTENNQRTLYIKFISSLGTSYNINLKVFGVSVVGTNFVTHFYLNRRIEPFILPNLINELSIKLASTIKFVEDENIYLVFLGNFSRDAVNTKIVPYKEVYLFNFKENRILDSNPPFDYTAFNEFLRRNRM
jgi:hypothetical protein